MLRYPDDSNWTMHMHLAELTATLLAAAISARGREFPNDATLGLMVKGAADVAEAIMRRAGARPTNPPGTFPNGDPAPLAQDQRAVHPLKPKETPYR